MSEFYAYCYRDPSRLDILGEPERIYVGKGKKKRWRDHLTKTGNTPFVNRLKKMRRNGVEPIIEFLCTGVDEELAFLVEIEAINKYGRKDLKRGTLLNLTDGGDGPSGMVCSEETRKKLSAVSLGRKRSQETCDRIAAGNTGKVKSKETIEKNRVAAKARAHITSAIHKGKTLSPEAREKIRLSLSGRTLPPEVREKIRLTQIARLAKKKAEVQNAST